MLEPPEILRTAAQFTAALHLTTPRNQIGNVMALGIQEVRSAVAAQGIATNGPWFTHHLRMEPDLFDFEICLPVAAPINPAGRVQPSQWPAMRVARTIYVGPYERLGAAWGEFESWIAAQGQTGSADLYERYLVGPETTSDSASFRTELNHPLTP